MIIVLGAICLVSYLFGSFPAGYLAGRAAGVDVRQHGSGNIGATNVLRVLGKPYGYAVFFVDALKGFLAVRLAIFAAYRIAAPHPEYFGITAAALAIVGHTFPVWLRFRGGKGVATAAGGLVGLMPLAAAAIALVWILVFEISRYVSLASIIAVAALPIVVAILLHFGLTTGVGLLYFSAVMAALIVWRHRTNISRLLAGTEPRFERK
ncbi:MAG: glycerol-3-phosphate 1-O-acyltransferase PlsY [Chthoniobacterales bacterium]|jgi:acyl phosphate:glycerol-3-phosphate acyltransferase